MKNLISIICLAISVSAFSQNVILNTVSKVSDNTDKFLYKIDPAQTGAEYLGELEVQGFSNNDEEVFGKIYKKAKEIGANTFSFQPFIEVDGTEKTFDPANYKLKLYYTEKADMPSEDNTIYIISGSKKSQKISFNDENIEFSPRTYIKKTLEENKIYTVSTRKFLGSGIKLSGKEGQPVQYFQLLAAKIRSNPYGTAGINLKSGDIITLERSYGEFLTTIYQQIK